MQSSNSKTKNSSRNLVFGIVLKFYQLLMPFLIRTIIINILGMEYAGLNSLFTSILQVLNIAELGVGTALVFSMYKPIKEHDRQKICALMKLYKIYYRIIGLVILLIGILIVPILPNLIKGDLPKDINLYVLYFLNLGATVLSYWLFAYKSSLFQAHQRNDIISKITILTDTLKYILQVGLLFALRSYYAYLVVLLITQVVNNILIAIQAKKTYSQYVAVGKLKNEEVKKINSSIKDLFYGQLGLVITTSVDSIVISAFLGLVPLAIYQNYYFILNALIGFFTIFYQSCRASIGTNLIVKSNEENFNDYKFITFIVFGVLTYCSACLINMYQPFIELWVGPENLLDMKCVVLFAVYFCVYEISLTISTYKDASGKWHVDRFRPLLTAIVNLVTNIILVKYIGLYGVLLSTILSFLIVNIPWLYHRVFIDVFDIKYKNNYTMYIAKKLFILILIVSISTIICNSIMITSIFFRLVFNLLLCSFITIALYILLSKNEIEFNRLNSLFRKHILKKGI